jgi:hypothetical protein
LENAVLTAPRDIPKEARRRLGLLLARLLKKREA